MKKKKRASVQTAMEMDGLWTFWAVAATLSAAAGRGRSNANNAITIGKLTAIDKDFV